ncbi:indole-3-glycerol phosphate synthase [Niastella yeongjuensis]|uniref:indole-3-glycerol-phosphate synthase n=1 Tax=Niastella yeongjuensis TaxID=354355 RepID=A0A1V9F190_9BACT|nr:indole-3-glycerol phosphate synthase TrpC [Niastella yeongjuensis]OQP52087.1 indole-3-glycerol phosphate synthase [Niastella yeongjuensis]SEP37286.1 indole-3-glycerol phosphate synthase [Niastella yeongjuensis]
MNILDKIIEHKRGEVAERKQQTSVKELEQQEGFKRSVLSLGQFLLDDAKTGIIAEFKRKSPSKGIINGAADVVEVTSAYARYGASGLSVLTDEQFFGGSTADLIKARVNQVPILRKDFMIDEYQIVEARAMGADVILLIAACLTPAEVKRLASFAASLQLEVLLELHAEEELEHICDETKLVGINNRNLKTFEVDIERSLRMAERIPAGKIKIAESGISSVANIRLFKENGFRGFLIGENFMKEAQPGAAFQKFIAQLETI